MFELWGGDEDLNGYQDVAVTVDRLGDTRESRNLEMCER